MRERIERIFDQYFEIISISLAVIVLLLVVAYPAGLVIYLSFFEVSYSGGAIVTELVGLENFKELISDAIVWQVLGQNITYMLGSTLITFFVGFVFALSLNRVKYFKPFFRGAALLPWVIAPVVAAMIWKWMLNDAAGLINGLIYGFHAPVSWLADPELAMVSVIMADAWTRIPLMTLLLLAGLQTIPKEMYEAAIVDGAGSIQQFRRITIPLVRPAMTNAVLITMIFSFRTYVTIQGVTQGGPARTTEIWAITIFKLLLQYWEIGKSSALSIMLLIIISVFISFYLKFVYKGVYN